MQRVPWFPSPLRRWRYLYRPQQGKTLRASKSASSSSMTASPTKSSRATQGRSGRFGVTPPLVRNGTVKEFCCQQSRHGIAGLL